MKYILYTTVITLLFSSCATGFKTSTYTTSDIKNIGATQTPTLVDLDVSETKIEATAKGNRRASVEVLKEQAIISAIKLAQADVLLEPQFDIESSRLGTSVKVVGFPAKYKNFRSAKVEDMPLIQNETTQQVQAYQPTQDKTKIDHKHKRRPVGGAILLTYLGIAMIAIIGIAIYNL